MDRAVERAHRHRRAGVVAADDVRPTRPGGLRPPAARNRAHRMARPSITAYRTPSLVNWWPSIRIAFGVIWLIDGVLEWQPADFHNFLQLITAMSQGQPAPLGAVISAGQAVVAINPTLANGLLAALETAVGLSLISNTLSRWALRISVLLAALIWVFGQGLGMVFMAGSTDVQSGPLYVLASLMLLRALPARSYRRSYLPMRRTPRNRISVSTS